MGIQMIYEKRKEPLRRDKCIVERSKEFFQNLRGFVLKKLLCVVQALLIYSLAGYTVDICKKRQPLRIIELYC